jgi:glycosyltransferase involved in cell wall biosynthesis
MSTPTAALAPVPAGPIRVLEIIGNAIVGGMETYVERLLERLPRERFTVSALCPYEGNYADRLRALDVEVHVTPILDNVPWCSVQMTCALIKSHNIDVLHSHLTNAHVLAGISGGLTGTPVLATIHGRQVTMLDLEVHRTANTYLGVLCKQSYFHALGLGVSATQLSCIPNGVDTDVFRPRQHAAPPALNGTGQAAPPQAEQIVNPQSTWRKNLGIPAAIPLVGFVGRLSVEKGPEVFLRAALLLHNTVPEAHFVMVGDGPMREQLKALCGRYSLHEFVHFAGVCEDMPSIYHELDLVVSTSHSEAMPLALMEAMASGLPVIATRVGGVPDLITQGQTGWLVEPRDFEGVAFFVGQLLASNEQREQMGAAARARAVERFGLTESVTLTADVLTRLALAKRGESRKISAVLGDAARKVARSARLGADARPGIRTDRSA